MLCKKPFNPAGMTAYKCGQCMPCRINRRREWSHRMMLESLLHENNCFVTLTYNDDNCPANHSLEPDHLRNFWKKLRKRVYPIKLRYYAVGEYGDESERPHYHAAVFGLGPEASEIIHAAWSKGHTMVGDLTHDSAQYIAGYVTKKLTNKNDPRLKGRFPEFARMSNRPGIGAGAASELAGALVCSETGQVFMDVDVPHSLMHANKALPIGRYIRRKTREQLGLDKKAPPEVQEQASEKMFNMYQDSQNDPKLKGKGFMEVLTATNRQRILNLETRFKLHHKKGKVL